MQGIAFSLQRSRGTQSPMSESHGCHFKPFPYKETPKMVICLKLIFFSFCQYCKSLLCSMFNEQTCSRFTRLFVRLFVTTPRISHNNIFLNSPGSKDIKTDIPNCQIPKYTNTQIQIHKYTNTAYDEVPEIPNICCIFEQLVVQGCQK